jgi:Tfp pilus assembly protein PilX
MSSRGLRSALINQRGIALPLSLIVLTLLTSLTLAFLAMSSTEPMIAANLKGGEQALALAEAGIERAIWALSNPTMAGLTNLNQVPAAYNNQQLFTLSGISTGAYAITISSGAAPNTITANGYVVRNGVAVPAQPAQLAQTDIAAHRIVQLQVTSSGPVGGPGAPNDVKLPGALAVAGAVQISGNSLVDGQDQAAGTPNSCAAKAGVTIRDKTTLADGTVVDNSITVGGSASTVGSPQQQRLTSAQFQSYSFTAAQLTALKALAQSQGTYIQPPSNAQFNLAVVNGLMFVDTVNAQPLGSSPDAAKLASVRITGANNSGWLIVMGSIRIDGNVTYNGFVYAHNNITYRGTSQGGIFGAMLTGNAVDSVATVVDSDTSGNSKIYYDCVKVANGGGALSTSVQDALNRVIVAPIPGTWREVSN